MSDVDTHLAERISRGDGLALGALFDRLADPVYAVAYHILGNRDDAEAVVEYVFTRVWAERNGHGAGNGSVWTWLVLLARSRAVEQLGRTREAVGRAVPGHDTGSA